LAGATATILIVAVGITFLAIYRGTGAQLRGAIDRELRGDVTAFANAGVPPRPLAPRAVEAAGRRFVRAQPFRPSAHLLVERVTGGGIVTNQPEVFGLAPEPDEPEARQRAENRHARELVTAPVGYSTVEVPDVGDVRLLTRVVRRGGRSLAVVGVGEPLAAVERAQRTVADRFAIAGSLTLIAGLAASFLVAGRLSRPLREMSAIAAEVDAGDLSPRIGARTGSDEVRILARTFDHMLDRLEDAFVRQRAFVADASHELRTPLTVIRGQLEVLARQSDPSLEDVRRVERLVRTEVARMQRLVDDLLVLAQADEGDFLHPREIRLASFVEELEAGIRPTADRRFEFGPVPDGTLRADPDRLAQALRNLLVNAVEHTSARDRVALTVEARDGVVAFAIDDSGPGIPLEQRQQVFDRFHRTAGARSSSGGGAGLGLAIVQAVADAHGGTVAVAESGLGGARIVLTLPGFG
jgi:signal transduction histidine kinase